MIEHGFLRVAAATPLVRVADCSFNAEHSLALMRRAEDEGVSLLVFPELGLTGYTCADLFGQPVLLRAALEALIRVAAEGGRIYSGLAFVGLPVVLDDHVFNCAAVLHRGRILGIVPKSFIPNYKEFYEGRWFAAAATAHSREVIIGGTTVPFGTDRLFAAGDVDGLVVGVEVCEDLWVPVPPSSHQALAGATVLVNLSASNEIIGKAAYRRQLVVGQSGRCLAAYLYASCGTGESTTDVVFGGHCLIAENGTLLAESERFVREDNMLVADIDLDRLRNDRMRTNSFGNVELYVGPGRPFSRVAFDLFPPPRRAAVAARCRDLRRSVEAHPFVPQGQELRQRC